MGKRGRKKITDPRQFKIHCTHCHKRIDIDDCYWYNGRPINMCKPCNLRHSYMMRWKRATTTAIRTEIDRLAERSRWLMRVLDKKGGG